MSDNNQGDVVASNSKNGIDYKFMGAKESLRVEGRLRVWFERTVTGSASGDLRGRADGDDVNNCNNVEKGSLSSCWVLGTCHTQDAYLLTAPPNSGAGGSMVSPMDRHENRGREVNAGWRLYSW